jgi:hypothetical protein
LAVEIHSFSTRRDGSGVSGIDIIAGRGGAERVWWRRLFDIRFGRKEVADTTEILRQAQDDRPKEESAGDPVYDTRADSARYIGRPLDWEGRVYKSAFLKNEPTEKIRI